MRRRAPQVRPSTEPLDQAQVEAAVVQALLEVCRQLRRLHPEPAYRRACDAVADWLQRRLLEERKGGERE